MSGSGWLRRCSLYNLNGADFRGRIDGPCVVGPKFEVATAEKVSGFDAARCAKGASIDCDNARGAVGSVGGKFRFGTAAQDEPVGGLLGEDQYVVAWAQGFQLQLGQTVLLVLAQK